MPIEPYLTFNGRCDEAIEHYRKALGAEIQMIMRFSESPEPVPAGMLPAGFETKVMHACLTVGGANLMLSDGMSNEPARFKGISLSLQAEDGEQAKRWFEALSSEGKVTMPFGETFFAKHFGMLEDRFGVAWMVIVPSDFRPGQ